VKSFVLATGGALVAAIALGAFGGAAGSDEPSAAGTLPSGWAGDRTCIDCHDDKGATLRTSPHWTAVDGESKRGLQVHCESCHGPGAQHADDPGAAPMRAMAKVPAAEQNGACLGCHTLPAEESGLQHQHAAAGLRCSECHGVHAGGSQRALLRSAPTALCLSCHARIASELRQVSHHPVLEGRLECSTCHVGKLESMSPGAPAGSSTRCVSCHTDHDVLAPFEHPAMNEVAIEGQGCTACHAPHGSANARLLQRPGKELCLQCHSVPRHSTVHGGIYANLNCQECHVDVHGSFTSARFFRSEMVGEGCFACHER